jgi:hypothetical protein
MSEVIIIKKPMQSILLCFYLCQTGSNYFFPFIISQKKMHSILGYISLVKFRDNGD